MQKVDQDSVGIPALLHGVASLDGPVWTSPPGLGLKDDRHLVLQGQINEALEVLLELCLTATLLVKDRPVGEHWEIKPFVEEHPGLTPTIGHVQLA